MKTNKNGVKLLAAIMVFAVAVAGVAVIFSDESYADADPIISFNSDAVVFIENDGNNYTISGAVPKSASTTEIDDTTFGALFGDKAIGYGYAILDKSIFTNAKIVVQKNSALKLYNGDSDISGDDTKGWVKTSNYSDKAGGVRPADDLAFLIPTDGSTVTFEITVGETVTTYTFNFEDVDTVDSISNTGFLALKNSNNVIALNKSYILTGTVTVASTLTVTMNGNSIYSNTDVFKGLGSGTDFKFTINGDDESQIIVKDNGEIPSVYYQSKDSTEVISLDVNGGYYKGVYVFSCGVNAKFGGSVSISDATITAYMETSDACEGIWTSYGGWETVEIDNTIVYSEDLGIYLGVQKNATLTNVNVDAVGTALEIKSGNIEVIGGSFTSDRYDYNEDGEIGNSSSGAGVNAVFINNGYSRANTGNTVSVSFSEDVKISNSNTNSTKPVTVIAGKLEDASILEDPITITGLKVSDVEIVKIEGGADITMNYSDIKSADVTTDVPAQKVESDTVLVLNADANNAAISVDSTKELTIITGGNAISGTVSFTDGVETFSIQVTGLKGDVTFSKGSVRAIGDFTSGSITLADGDVLKIAGTISNDFVINGPAGNGQSATVIVEDGYTLTIASGKTLSLTGNVKMNNDGNIVGNGTIDVPTSAQFYTSKPVSINFSGNGTIILEDAVEELELGKILGSVFETKPTQKVIANQNLTIAKDQYLVITGGLYIPEGVTITIADGGLLMLKGPTAYAEIDGTIKSNGRGTYNATTYAGFTVADDVRSDVIINGSIIAAKSGETTVTSVDIAGNAELTGKVIVNSKAKANFGKLIITETGVLEDNGTISGTLYNQGSVIINGAVDASGMTVYQNAVTGIVDIQNLKGGELTVSDEKLYLRTVESTKILVGDSAANA